MIAPHTRLLCAPLLLSLLLAGCQRGGSETPVATLDPSFQTFATFTPDPNLPPAEPDGGEPALPTAQPIPDDPAPDGGATTPPEPAPPAATTRLSGLRFATTSDGPAGNAFPLNTEQICALFDYRDLTAADVIRRVWTLDEVTYVERQEPWPIDRYGPTGTARDVCLYDWLDGYIDGAVDGIDPGSWRVDLYLNGTLEASGQFTVGQ